MSASCIVKLELDINICAVAFCPFKDLEHYLAVGAYQLDEQTQSRTGALFLYCHSAVDNTLTECARVSTCGIFDLRWFELEGRPWLASATSDGSIQTYRLVDSHKDEEPLACGRMDVRVSAETMVTSVDAQRVNPDSGRQLCFSTSTGRVGLATVTALLPESFHLVS